MITSDNAKTIVILFGAVIGVYIGVSVYSKMKKTGQYAAETMQDAKTAFIQTKQEAQNWIADRAMGLIPHDTGSATNPDYVAPDYVIELPFSKWPQSAKDEINMLNRTRGITRVWTYAGDFSGWHVYSNGTIISPDGYYLRDLVSTGDYTGEGVAVTEIPNAGGFTFDQTKYQWQTSQDVSAPDPLQFG